MSWLDRIPWPVIVLIAVFMALAPFVPEPHLWQKLKMLFAGTLRRPVDIFDLFWHCAPAIILALKLLRRYRGKNTGVTGG